jgi:hypothetical protein
MSSAHRWCQLCSTCRGFPLVLSLSICSVALPSICPRLVLPWRAIPLLTLFLQGTDPETAAKTIDAKLPLWSKTYDLPLKLLTEVRELHLNPAKSAGPNEALLQDVMSIAVASVSQHAACLSKLFLSQELRCLAGLLPVGTMHYHQNMVPSNSHVLALIEPSDLPAFEVAFKAYQAEDRPAGILGTSTSHFSRIECVLASHMSQSRLPLLILPNLPKQWQVQSGLMDCLYRGRLRRLVLFTVMTVAAA